MTQTNTLGTFLALFPIGNYFGVLADTGPSPMTFIDAHPRIQVVFPHDVSASTDLVLYWRKSLLDGVYNVPGFLIRGADNSLARFVGYRPGVEVRWEIDRHAFLQADYEMFLCRQVYPGNDAGKESQPSLFLGGVQILGAEMRVRSRYAAIIGWLQIHVFKSAGIVGGLFLAAPSRHREARL